MATHIDLGDNGVGIVGGGLAGAAAAIVLAGAGVPCTVFSDGLLGKGYVGETVHPDVAVLLNALGVAESLEDERIAVPHRAIRSIWGGVQRVRSFENPGRSGYHLNRSAIGHRLLTVARAAGVSVREREHVSVVSSQNRTTLRTRTDEQRFRIIVDASGSAHWAARAFGLRITAYSPRLVARYGFFAPSPDDSYDPVFSEIEDGWSWSARVGVSLQQRMELHWREDLSIPKTPLPRGADVTWRVVEPRDEDIFFAGDSFAVVDPASSHGIIKALLSGISCGRAISHVMQGRLSLRDAASKHHGWMRRLFDHDIAGLRVLYGQHVAPPEWLRDAPRLYCFESPGMSTPISSYREAVR